MCKTKAFFVPTSYFFFLVFANYIHAAHTDSRNSTFSHISTFKSYADLDAYKLKRKVHSDSESQESKRFKSGQNSTTNLQSIKYSSNHYLKLKPLSFDSKHNHGIIVTPTKNQIDPDKETIENSTITKQKSILDIKDVTYIKKIDDSDQSTIYDELIKSISEINSKEVKIISIFVLIEDAINHKNTKFVDQNENSADKSIDLEDKTKFYLDREIDNALPITKAIKNFNLLWKKQKNSQVKDLMYNNVNLYLLDLDLETFIDQLCHYDDYKRFKNNEEHKSDKSNQTMIIQQELLDAKIFLISFIALFLEIRVLQEKNYSDIHFLTLRNVYSSFYLFNIFANFQKLHNELISDFCFLSSLIYIHKYLITRISIENKYDEYLNSITFISETVLQKFKMHNQENILIMFDDIKNEIISIKNGYLNFNSIEKANGEQKENPLIIADLKINLNLNKEKNLQDFLEETNILLCSKIFDVFNDIKKKQIRNLCQNVSDLFMLNLKWAILQLFKCSESILENMITKIKEYTDADLSAGVPTKTAKNSFENNNTNESNQTRKNLVACYKIALSLRILLEKYGKI